jgi:hypothetical protein
LPLFFFVRPAPVIPGERGKVLDAAKLAIPYRVFVLPWSASPSSNNNLQKAGYL